MLTTGVIMAAFCVVQIHAQLAPTSSTDLDCPFGEFSQSVMHIDGICCVEQGSCSKGQPPAQCPIGCAEAYLPFFERCSKTIGTLFDNRDGTADQRAEAFEALADTCLDNEMIGVKDALDRVKELRADGCVVDLAEADGVETAERLNPRVQHDQHDIINGGHRILQLIMNAVVGNSNACADMATLQARADDMNTACCPTPDDCPNGVPKKCSAECALVFAPFFEDCQVMLSAAMEDTVVHQLLKLGEICVRQPVGPILMATAAAACPACGNDRVDSGEECDDGAQNSNNPNSSCRPNCLLPTCGDGIVDDAPQVNTAIKIAEVCDPPSEATSCTTTCQVDPCAHVECGHGTCVDGECICSVGWDALPDCSRCATPVGRAVQTPGWINSFDHELDYTCPANSVMVGIFSEHDNYYEDRRFKISCSTVATHVTNGAFTDYINAWDRQFDYTCSDESLMVGLYSVHDNWKEDRRTKVRCGTIGNGHTVAIGSLGSYQNDWDQRLDFHCPPNSAIKRIESDHDNHKEDRRFKIQCASIDLGYTC